MNDKMTLNNMILNFEDKKTKTKYSVVIDSADIDGVESINKITTSGNFVFISTDKGVRVYTLVPKENDKRDDVLKCGIPAHWIKSGHDNICFCSNCKTPIPPFCHLFYNYYTPCGIKMDEWIKGAE